jgi:hypothetical protein
MYLLGLVAFSAFAQERMPFSTQSTWFATTSNSNWLYQNREKLLDTVLDQHKTGVVQSVVEQRLGSPQSICTVDGTNIWTYGLYWRIFYHMAFDKNERVADATFTSYRQFSHEEISVMTNVPALSSNPCFDIAAWKTIRKQNSRMFNCIQMVAGASRVLFPEMAIQDVEAIFGQPDYVTERQHQTILSYRIGFNDFLQLVILNKSELLGAHIRCYYSENGRLSIIPLSGVVDSPDDPLLDEACWRATFSEGIINNIRTGIGIRMSKLIAKGTTQQEVMQRLGPPSKTNQSVQSLVYKYDIAPDSFFLVLFNPEGTAEQIRMVK